MIESYEIKIINGKEVLLLNINLDNEFGIFGNKINLNKYIKNFIRKNKIAFAGTIVALAVSGTLVYSMDLGDNKLTTLNKEVNKTGEVLNAMESKNVEEGFLEIIPTEDTLIKDEKIVSNELNFESTKTEKNNNQIVVEIDSNDSNEEITSNGIYVLINRNNEVLKIELEDYTIGVVGAEMPASFEEEALKSQAIIARTYALKAISKGKTLTDNNSTQDYKNNEGLKKLWGSEYDKYFNKVKNAVMSTEGLYLS